jgi:hypothetical protein
MIRRRTMLAGGGAALAVGGLANAAGVANPLAATIAADGQSMKVVRVLLRNDGKTRIAEGEVGADKSPYPLFKQFLTHNATATTRWLPIRPAPTCCFTSSPVRRC